MYAGVDEAGRGPVLGPLVVAGVAGHPDQIPDGVADSKQLTAAHREELAERIRSSALQIAIRTVTVDELDEQMQAGRSLDRLEAEAFAAVLDELAPERALADQVGPAGGGFADTLEALVEHPCEIEAEVEADASDPMVSAASIVAKVERDAAMERIGEALDAEVGSGYPSDPVTRAFLERWREASIQPPPCARKAWATLDEIGFGQARLGEQAETIEVPDPRTSKEEIP